MSTPPFPNMDELLQRLLDDQIEPDEMQRLAKAIREDPRVRDYYLDSLLVSAVIRRSSQVTGELSKSDLIRAISSGAGQGGSKRLGRRFLSIAALLMLGVLVLASLYLVPSPRLKARRSARWPASMRRNGEGLIRVRANRCTPVPTICARVWRRWIWTRGRASCSKLLARSSSRALGK